MKIPFLGLEISKPKKKAISYSTTRASVNDIANLWAVSNVRKNIYDDIDRMYDEDGYVAQAIDVLAADILQVKDPYEPILKVWCPDERLKAEIKDALKQAEMDFILRTQVIHSYLKYGNAYCEFVLYANSNDFSRLSFIPDAWSIHRNTDNHAQLKNGKPELKKVGECAYDQRDDSGGFLAGFYPYQIVHWRMPPFDKSGDGTPFVKAMRRNWLRLQFAEDSTSIARIVRAFLKLIHHVPVPENATQEEIDRALDRYIKSQTRQRLNQLNSGGGVENIYANAPSNVTTDYFAPTNSQMKGHVDTIDPQNTQLTNLKDLEYFQNEKFARLQVPKARLANERDVNAKATLVEQNTAYAATITGFQIDLLSG